MSFGVVHLYVVALLEDAVRFVLVPMLEHRMGERRRQHVVVFLQRVLRIVQHQRFQRVVNVIRLREPVTARRLVDDAVVHRVVASAKEREQTLLNFINYKAYRGRGREPRTNTLKVFFDGRATAETR